MSTEMVSAILEGRKTRTRRVINEKKLPENQDDYFVESLSKRMLWLYASDREEFLNILLPYIVGDIMWVKETYHETENGEIIYRADDPHRDLVWKPSLFMPKKVARIFLEVTHVNAERLHDITPEEAVKEGIRPVFFGIGRHNIRYKNYTGKGLQGLSAIHSFQSLWESINGENSWLKNPWVWVYSFRIVERNEL